MQGILARADDRDLLAAVEEGITDGAVADAPALKLSHAGNRQRTARSTGGEHDGRRFPFVLLSLCFETIECVIEGER